MTETAFRVPLIVCMPDEDKAPPAPKGADEETDNALNADARNFYKLEK